MIQNTGFNWSLADFIVMAGLLVFAGGGLWLAFRATKSWTHRAAVAMALLASFLLFWVTGAVGIIGSENNDANMLFLLVPVIWIAGGLVTRLNPLAMARVLVLTGAAQALIGGVALALGLGTEGHAWPWDIVGASLIFTALWIAAAYAFKRASLRQPAL